MSENTKNSRGSKPPQQTLNQKSSSCVSSTHQSKSQTTTVAETNLDDVFANSCAGAIKKISLTNFMCHADLEIELNPRVNSISGVNCSGESAIQTAIAVGLGGIEWKTNRSSKLADLIKRECNTASITIILDNVGTNAFKPAEYGKEIRVIRDITPSSSTYRLFSQSGKLISNKKQELDTICTQFRIQPNNPVGILNHNSVIAEEQKELLQRAAEQNDAKMTRMAEKLDGEFACGEAYALRDEVVRLEKICAEEEQRKHEAMKEIKKMKAEINVKESKIEELLHTISQLQTRTKEETIQKTRLGYRCTKYLYDEKCEEYEKASKKIDLKKSDVESILPFLIDIKRDEAEQITKREEAQMAIVELNKQITACEDKVEKLHQETSMLRNTAEQKEKTIHQLHEGIKANERQMGSLKNSEDRISRNLRSMPHRMRSPQEKIAEQKAAIAREQSELEQLVGQQSSVQRRLDEMNDLHQKFYKEKNKKQNEISEEELAMELKKINLKNKYVEKNRIIKEIANLEEQKQKLHQEVEEAGSEMRRAKELMDQCSGADIIVEQFQLGSEVEKYNDQVGVLRRKMAVYEKKIEDGAVKINLLQRRINEAREKFQSKTDPTCA